MSTSWTYETRVYKKFHTDWKTKALASTLKDTVPEDDTDHNDNKGILNSFPATIDSINWGSKQVDDEEDLVVTKFQKTNDEDDNNTVYQKFYKFSEKQENLYRRSSDFTHHSDASAVKSSD